MTEKVETNNMESSTIPIFVTVFYSNYSSNSKALLQSINNTHLMDTLNLKFINIDNNVMKRIVSKKFSVVPTIVVMINNEISLYQGYNAFEWFNKHMTEIEALNISSLNVNNSSTPNTLSESTIEISSPETMVKPKTILEVAAAISKARET